MKKNLIWIGLTLVLTPSIVLGADLTSAEDILGNSKHIVLIDEEMSHEKYKFSQINELPPTAYGSHKDIGYVEKQLKMYAASGLDPDILACLVSYEFRGTDIKSAKGQEKVRTYLNENYMEWRRLINRYKGDYVKMLEATHYKESTIDYLSARYGDKWRNYLSDAKYLGDDTDQSSIVSYADEVLSYWGGER